MEQIFITPGKREAVSFCPVGLVIQDHIEPGAYIPLKEPGREKPVLDFSGYSFSRNILGHGPSFNILFLERPGDGFFVSHAGHVFWSTSQFSGLSTLHQQIFTHYLIGLLLQRFQHIY